MVNWFLTRVLRPLIEEKIAFQQIILEQQDIHMQKSEIGPLSYMLLKN